MGLRSLTRTWSILNYAVSEPDEWTCRAIAEDLGENTKHVGMAVRSLQIKGFLVKGRKIGRARALFPTPEGVEALYTAI